ncbi:MAG: FAD-binding protein, partial [Dehalococcoidia bacterium]|nr:FAD-binding protein [Dehalococcoidia bacterium]
MIGGGGAGVTAAASAARAGARVAILSKEPVGCGNTRIAFGGFTGGTFSAGDSPEELFKDMQAGGEGLGNPPLAQSLARDVLQGPRVAEGLGHIFRRNEEGEASGSAIGRPGGHRFSRNASSPSQGVALGGVLHNTAFRAGVEIMEETVAFQLLGRGRVEGLMAFDLRDGRIMALAAKAVVLACGGAGWLYYPHTDCVRPSTGDGFALALEAGAELMGMEFMQFLPFSVTHPPSYIGIFLGEPSSTGPDGRLVNGKGETVMSGMMSNTRAQVSRVIALEIAAGNVTAHGGISLDLSPNLETTRGREVCSKLRSVGSFDQARAIYGERAYLCEEPWDVAPTAHFSAGGVRINEGCCTTLEGLYAAGEVAGGIHGADRLGGIALTEAFLFGWKAGQAAASRALGLGPPRIDPGEAQSQAHKVEALIGKTGRHRPITLMRRLQKLMWDEVGVVRTEEGLKQALSDIADIEEAARDLKVRPGRLFNT